MFTVKCDNNFIVADIVFFDLLEKHSQTNNFN